MNQGTGVFHSAPLSRSASLLISSCAVVATAAYLGVGWLRETTLGVPAGMWVIAAIQAQGWLISRARANTHQAIGMEPPTTGHAVASRVLGRVIAAIWESVRVVAKTLRIPQPAFRSFEDQLAVRADIAPRAPRPLRIGLDAGPETRRAITQCPSDLGVEWVVLSPSADDQAALRQHSLDVLLRSTGEGNSMPMRIVSLEHPEREAAWFDWSTPRPLTYAAVFPVRIDPAQVSLADVDLTNPAQADLLAATLRAAAALSRCPARLRLSDRFCGRLPSGRGAEGVRTPNSLADRALLELVNSLTAASPSQTPIAKAAARAVGAWLATTEAWLDLGLRRKGVEAALASVGNEPEMLLRAAALRLAMFDDDAAFQALRESEALIRSGAHPTLDEHLAFLQAELELGSPNPLTLGRVAAGICIVCATSPRERVAFIRGDIMDDVRHSAWLVGRDQDRAVLREVFSLMGADQANPGPWELRDAA